MIRLIGSGLLLLASLVAVAITPDRLIGPDAWTVSGVTPSTAVGRLLVGLVQVVVIVALVAVVVVVLRRRRFRLLGTLVGGAIVAALLMRLIDYVVDRTDPTELTANIDRGGWIGSAAFPSAMVFAGAVAIAVTVTRWLSASWRRTTWIALGLVAVARVVSGTVLPMWLVIAFAVGATVGTGLLVAFGAPDRRPGPAEVVAALCKRLASLSCRRCSPRSPARAHVRSSSRMPRGTGSSSRSSGRTSVTPTCSTAPTGSFGCATSVTCDRQRR